MVPLDPLDPLARAAFDDAKPKKVNLFDSPRMFLDVYGLLPGQKQKPHRHDDADKIYYVLEGRGAVTIGDRTHRLDPGRAAICPAGLDHGVENDGGEKLVLLVMMTKPRA